MRAVVLVAVLGACGFSKEVGGDDVPGEPRTLTDAELAGGARDGVVAGGNVEPDGFVVGGLYARAFQAQLVDNGEDFTKVLADTAGIPQAGAGYAQVPTDWDGNSRPRGLGLASNDGFTVIYTGEILLPKGEVTLEVDVDDRGVVEVLGQRVSNDGAAPLEVAEAGWYPIRAAITQNGGNSKMLLTLVQEQVRTVVDAARLRARVTAENGLVVYVFEQERFVKPRLAVARPTIAETFGFGAPPYDLDLPLDRFSLRFAGQLRIDTAGTYRFDATLDGDDNWRLWIDGNVVANRWLGLADVPQGSVDLAPGWHSILVDYNEGFGDAQIAVRMTGPDAPNGGTIDPKRLRPVVVTGNTYTFAANPPVDIGDVTSTFVKLPLPAGDASEEIDAVDYAFRIENQQMSALEVTLFDCSAGKTLTTGTLPGYFYYAADKTCAGKTPHPVVEWQLRLADSIAGNTPFAGNGRVLDYGLSALYHGGPKTPFAPVFTYTSEPKATPGARRITAARATGTLDRAQVEIAVRAADDPAALEAQAFEVVHDDVKVTAVGEFVQYRVTISTNGWISPVLDGVEIDYIAE